MEYIDVVTPYGLSGFAINGEDPDLLYCWRDLARERGYVCGYVTVNPLFASDAFRTAHEYVEYNDVYVLEIGQSESELLTGLSVGRRRELRAFKKGAMRLIEDRAAVTAFFLEHADAFFKRKRTTAAYNFSEATLKALAGLESVLIIGIANEDVIDAVCLFAYSPHCADALFEISAPERQAHSAALLWAGATRLRSMGISRLNLGGGINRGDGVAQFKERFGARKLPLGCLKQVYRPDVYEELCHQVGADPRTRVGYFPAFRNAYSRNS